VTRNCLFRLFSKRIFCGVSKNGFNRGEVMVIHLLPSRLRCSVASVGVIIFICCACISRQRWRRSKDRVKCIVRASMPNVAVKLVRSVRDAVVMLWTVGGRLRRIYNSSTSEQERRRDRRGTVVKFSLFVAFCATILVADRLGPVSRWPRRLAR
jgi:hypothetical protein